MGVKGIAIVLIKYVVKVNHKKYSARILTNLEGTIARMCGSRAGQCKELQVR